MNVYAMQGQYLSEITYVVAAKGKAVIIDPGLDSERILSELKRLSLSPVAVLLTHGHIDHIYGAAGLRARGIKVYAHKEELPLIGGKANLSLVFRLVLPPLTVDVAFSDDEELSLPGFSVKTIFTPGHTAGGACYLIEDALFTGDTLFPASYGRTDFPTGDEQDLICSIANELFALPPETKVYSGHGVCSAFLCLIEAQTTIGKEYSTNPILDLL